MRLHRFIGNFDLTKNAIEILDRDLINQWKNVLRLSSGDKLILCDGKLNEAQVIIDQINKDSVMLEIEKLYENESEPTVLINLYAAILKHDNFEFLVRDATGAGMSKLMPIISARTIKTNVNEKRINIIAKEAAEQSGRGIVPEISEKMPYEKALEDSKNNDINIIFDPEGMDLKDVELNNRKKIGIFIGPEGGWAKDELENAKKHGVLSVNLGKLILRGEAAAITAVWAINQRVQ